MCVFCKKGPATSIDKWTVHPGSQLPHSAAQQLAAGCTAVSSGAELASSELASVALALAECKFIHDTLEGACDMAMADSAADAETNSS